METSKKNESTHYVLCHFAVGLSISGLVVRNNILNVCVNVRVCICILYIKKDIDAVRIYKTTTRKK